MKTAPGRAEPVYQRRLRSRFQEVEGVCLEFRDLCVERGWTAVGFGTELVLRECLNNAVLHGNRRDPSKTVALEVVNHPLWIRVQVTDEGPGFDWRAMQRKGLPGGEATHGRGLCIAHAYARRVRFNRVGNQITLWFSHSPIEVVPPSYDCQHH